MKRLLILLFMLVSLTSTLFADVDLLQFYNLTGNFGYTRSSLANTEPSNIGAGFGINAAYLGADTLSSNAAGCGVRFDLLLPADKNDLLSFGCMIGPLFVKSINSTLDAYLMVGPGITLLAPKKQPGSSAKSYIGWGPAADVGCKLNVNPFLSITAGSAIYGSFWYRDSSGSTGKSISGSTVIITPYVGLSFTFRGDAYNPLLIY